MNWYSSTELSDEGFSFSEVLVLTIFHPRFVFIVKPNVLSSSQNGFVVKKISIVAAVIV